MRIVMMGLLVGSALGALAGTAVSAYVAPATQITIVSEPGELF